MKIGRTRCIGARLPRFGDHRHRNPNQQSNDRNHDKQFNQCKTV